MWVVGVKPVFISSFDVRVILLKNCCLPVSLVLIKSGLQMKYQSHEKFYLELHSAWTNQADTLCWGYSIDCFNGIQFNLPGKTINSDKYRGVPVLIRCKKLDIIDSDTLVWSIKACCSGMSLDICFTLVHFLTRVVISNKHSNLFSSSWAGWSIHTELS